jgi:hypothetical protein
VAAIAKVDFNTDARKPMSFATFPIFFVLLWLTITTVLGLLSGWYFLMTRYPNREEEELLSLKGLSGSMGLWVRMNRILNISVCPTGLRIGMMRVFGIFCRDFFVPWEEIRISRKNGFLGQIAELQFGNPPAGTLRIPSHLADRLARASLGRWREPGPFPEETKNEVFFSIAKQWIVMTLFAATFFIVVPRMASPEADFPPVSVAILFPGVVFGFASAFEYFKRTKR